MSHYEIFFDNMIEALALRAHQENRRMASEFIDQINGRVEFYNRSVAQQLRWARFHKFNGGKK